MIIGLVGFIGAGKGTIGDMLVAKGFHEDSFALPLKHALCDIFGWDFNMLNGKTPESRLWREQSDKFWSKKMGKEIIPRKMLQEFGTDICQNHIHRNVWAISLQNRIKDIDNVIVTDVRFQHELKALNDMGGYIIRVKRGDDPFWVDILHHLDTDEERCYFMDQFDIHRSEWDWVGYDFEYTIDNNGSIDKLCLDVNEMIYKIRSSNAIIK